MTDRKACFREIERWLEEKGCVTYRGLACSVDVTAVEAKSALFQYISSCKENYKVTILESSRGKEKLSFRFKTIDSVEAAKKILDNGSSKDVYAIHGFDSSDHPHLAMQGWDYSQVEEATRGSSTLVNFATNKVGLVRMEGIDSNIRKVRRAVNDASKSSYDASKPVTSSSMHAKKSNSTPSVPSSSSSKTSSIDSATKNKLANKASEFFNKKANSKSKPDSIPSRNEANNEKVVQKKSNKNVEEEWDEEDSEDERAAKDRGKIVPDKSKIKKRKVAASAPNGSGGVHQSDVVLNDHEKDQSGSDDDDNDSKSKRKKKEVLNSNSEEKTVFKRHGAMDDFIEDAALKEKEKNVDGDAATRPKRKKLVEKMFADEKGYLVTEMVLEEVSDDDDNVPATENIKRPTSDHATSTRKSSSAAPKKPKSGASASQKKTGGMQKSMTAFFGKKA